MAKFVAIKKIKQSSKSRSNLVLSMSKFLKILGLKDGDTVSVTLDTKNDTITIKKPDSTTII